MTNLIVALAVGWPASSAQPAHEINYLAKVVMRQSAEDYRPTGPKIAFTMWNGSSFEITTDPKRSPKTVEHILALVKKGFYDGQRVHRVEWWVTQWGAPASKSEPLDIKSQKTGKMEQNPAVGDGGSGKDIPVFEGSKDVDYFRGVVGVASTGLQVPGDSQIFVLKKDALRLFNSYAVVGKVTKGMDVVGRIQRGDRFRRAQIVK
jgi:cyclophilin family peptidyl-prolyl cis-trans isomerase